MNTSPVSLSKVAAQPGSSRKNVQPIIPPLAASAVRSVIIVSADSGLRQRLKELLTGLRWRVREAAGGAEAVSQMEESCAEAVLLDTWLPDLEVGELAAQLQLLSPATDLLRMDGGSENGGARSSRRNELLHALRHAQPAAAVDEAAWLSAPESVLKPVIVRGLHGRLTGVTAEPATPQKQSAAATPVMVLPEMVGESPPMRELAEMIRLVAPRSTTVLIEGPTGSGKEVVARAIHRLSNRASKPFAVLNCAAIPEALLEAELFGHTRGAFTGAVQSRTGRIEAADGGTLFLDEIGEMPLPLQAKMLRFLECGELQRVGDNETVHVDVRVIAATHQHLEKRAAEKTFREDLYYRLAVFPISVPPLAERKDDIPLLAAYLMAKLGEASPIKRLTAAAQQRLMDYTWPGNVRELGHVLERACILAAERPEITPAEIRFGSGQGNQQICRP